jgi:hypothetical protein
MQRIGVNAAFNSGAIYVDGRYLLMVRVEGWDRKSYFAVAESPNGIDNFQFWDRPVTMPETAEPDTNVYDMRLVKHQDGWIYGIFCSERKDPAAPSPYFREAFKEYQRAININPSYHEALNAYAYTYWVFRLHWPNRKLYTLGLPELDNLAEYYAEKALRLPKMEQNDYWQVIYSRTDAEVFIANGKFRKARNILIGLEQPVNTVPGSYMLDDLRWDLAQASYCLAVQDKEQKDALEADAKNQLSLIRANEEGLETYIFNYNYSPDQLIINYRLPCGELTRQFGNSR